jgi:N-acetylglucosamine kinase-like BadF-type ATPase
MVDGRLLLGIDGGNTKTVALVARADGTVVGTARRLACADPYVVGLAEAAEVVIATAEEARLAAREAGAHDSVAQAAASMAGADWPEDITEGPVRRREREVRAAPPGIRASGRSRRGHASWPFGRCRR